MVAWIRTHIPAIGGALFTLLALCVSFAAWLRPQQPVEDKPQIAVATPPDFANAKLDEASVFVSHGPESPTLVSFQYKGTQPGIVHAVDFSVHKKGKTPTRQVKVATAYPISVYFTADEAVDGGFRRIFKIPQRAPNDEWTTLFVAVIDPNEVGTTYVGDLTVYYDDLAKEIVRGVELDVLGVMPQGYPR